MFLLLVCTLSVNAAEISTSVALHLPLSTYSTTLVWDILPFTTSDVGEQNILWVIYQACWGLVVCLVVDNEVVCLRSFGRAIVLALMDLFCNSYTRLPYLPRIDPQSIATPRYLVFSAFATTYLSGSVDFDNPSNSSLASPGQSIWIHHKTLWMRPYSWSSLGIAGSWSVPYGNTGRSLSLHCGGRAMGDCARRTWNLGPWWPSQGGICLSPLS